MSESKPENVRDTGLPPEAARDLEAFRTATLRDLPGLDHSLSLARSRRVDAAGTWKERWLSMMNPIQRNPWLATAAAVAVVVVALMVVPFSYEKTSSHDVTLTLSGLGDPSQIRGIASEFEAALGAKGVQVQAEMSGAGPKFVLEASVPGNSGELRANAFGQALLDRGYHATWTATPKTDRVWGSMYAYARDRVIQVSVDGKTSQQLQDEIRQKLAAAGITNTQVSVTDLSSGGREVKVKAEHQAKTGDGSQEPIELQLTKNGQPLGGEGQSVQVRRMKDASGTERLVLDITAGGRTTKVEIPNPQGMTDAAISAEINAKLMQNGVTDFVCEVSGTEFTVRKR
jgi:type IV pilus biogenesis protein CpaD/CtpE